MEIDIIQLKRSIVVIFTISLSLCGGFYISTATAFPQNPTTYNYFVAISEMPFINHTFEIGASQFWREGGDCTDRAIMFKEYLHSKGAKDIHLIIARKIVNGKEVTDHYGGKGHCFVLWEGKVYNPMPAKDKYSIYGGDFEEYKHSLKVDYGYNTLYVDYGKNGIIKL